jgi:hypothetical protein
MSTLGKAYAAVFGARFFLLTGSICLAVGVAIGVPLGLRLNDGKVARMETALAKQSDLAARATIAEMRKRGRITDQVSASAAEHQASIQLVTRTNLEKVPVYVTKQADGRCTLSVGFVRMHDANAAGVPADSVPLAAGQSYDDASGVALSTLTDVLVWNYGAANSTRRNLIDLQDWIRHQQAVSEKPPS